MKFMDAYENTTALNEMDFRKMVEDTNNSPIVIKQRSLSRFDIVAPLSNALCAETVFETMTFKGHWKEIEMQKCIFKDCIFEQVTGSSISFIGSTFIDCIFLNCRIPRTDFTKCNFEKLKITDSDLNRANFSLSNIADIDVHNCKINNTLLEDTEKKKEEQSEDIRKSLLTAYQAVEHLLSLGSENFEDNTSLSVVAAHLHDFIESERAKLSDISNLRKMDAGDLEFKIGEHEKVVDSPVKISEIPVIDLSQYDFTGYNFQEHNLSCINFSGSSLRDCCFAGCDLSGCDFSNCDLTGAIMFNAHFNQVNFDGAILDELVLDNKNRDAFMKAGILAGVVEGDKSREKDGVYM